MLFESYWNSEDNRFTGENRRIEGLTPLTNLLCYLAQQAQSHA